MQTRKEGPTRPGMRGRTDSSVFRSASGPDRNNNIQHVVRLRSAEKSRQQMRQVPGTGSWSDRMEHRFEEFMSRVRTTKREPFGSRRNGRRGKDPKKASFWKDGMVRVALFSCAFVIVGSMIAIPTAFASQTASITVNDGGRILALSTSAQTVGQCLADNSIEIGPQDVLAQDPGSEIVSGMEIKIWRASQITVNSAGDSSTVSMVSGTVEDALNAAGIVPAPEDEVYPSLDTPIRAGMRVEHIIVTKDTTTHTYDIPYEKVEREDPDLPKGETKIVQEGKDGEFEITTETVYKNGVVFSQTVTSEKTLREPVNQITAVGTYVPPPPPPEPPTINEIHNQGSSGGGSSKSSSSSGSSSSGSSGSSSTGGGSSSESSSSSGGSSSESSSSESSGSSSSESSPASSSGGDGTIPGTKYTLQMQATAYCKACDSGHGITASGTYASWGTVAANTGVLPFGTKIYVEGYGYGVVEDTGGFSSNVIDLYLGDRDVCTCGSDWGRRNVTVYVIG